MKNNMNERGFTLIEIAIVLVIIAILLGSFISTLTVRIEHSQVESTKDELEEIKQALIGYVFTNGYLPCADCIGLGCPNGANTERDGFEDITPPGGVGCDVGGATGTLPWATLAIGGGDAWNTRYRYWVDPNFTDIGGITLASTGNGVIEEPDYVTDPTGATPQNLATNVVAVVYSHGKNALGGISADNIFRPAIDPLVNIDENENANHDTIFHSRPPTPEDAATAGGPFDDIVIWISEYELKAKMVKAGVLP